MGSKFATLMRDEFLGHATVSRSPSFI
jgi:hypothetical protein